MPEDFQASKPIFLQVVDRIYYSIVRSEIKGGEKLPFPLVPIILYIFSIKERVVNNLIITTKGL